MDIGILMRSADFLAALFLKIRHEASIETSHSHCLVVLFSSDCIMQLIRSEEGANCTHFSLKFFGSRRVYPEWANVSDFGLLS
jgi:hypothetical protein